MLFVRNPGKLRLGLYIAVLKDGFDTEMAALVFPQVAHIVTTLAFMDEVREFIVKYDQEGGDEDEE